MTTELDALVAHMEQTRSTMEQAVANHMPTKEQMNAFYAEIEAEERTRRDAYDVLVKALTDLLNAPDDMSAISQAKARQAREAARAALAKVGVK